MRPMAQSVERLSALSRSSRSGGSGGRLRVVQVLPALHGGGVERGTLEVAQALVEAGHESTVLSGGGRLVAVLQRGGSRHLEWPLGRKHPATLLQVARLRRYLAAERPAILHARSRLPAWICYLAWRRMPRSARPRFVTTVHGLYSVNAYSGVMAKGERVVAVSETVRRYVRDHYPRTPPERLALIYRGVDKARFHKGYRPGRRWLEAWRQQHPQLVGKRLATLPGRITRLKGHHHFIDALESVRRRFPDVAGLVVGGGAGQHRRYAAELARRAPWLTFAGHREDVREIMAVSSVVVSLSTHPESFGRTTLEALSLGTPVVGYDHGGVGEVLAQVFPEGRVAANDPNAAATGLAAVLADEAGARRAVREHSFDRARMCAETLALYAELARAQT